MLFIHQNRQRLTMIGSAAAPFALALILVPFRSQFASTAAALLLAAVVVAAAMIGDRFTGIVASVSAALWFDFFLTEPYGRFAITHRADLETTLCILLVGGIVTEVVERGRQHQHASAERSELVTIIYEMGEIAATSISKSMVIDAANELLSRILFLKDCQFELGSPTRPRAHIATDGEVISGDILWPAHQIGIPGPEAEILVRWGSHIEGRFVLIPTPGIPVPLDRRILSVALSRLVGAALTDPQRVP